MTGIRTFTKQYPSGATTNLELENFFESEITIICDPWIDKNALKDTVRLKKPVMSLCDTNNYTFDVTKIIPCNNKSKNSIIMCDTCGCGETGNNIKIRKPGEESSEHHHHNHEHDHHHDHEKKIDIEVDILRKNNLLAERNRGFFEAKDIKTFNLVSSPGSGKTSLLEKTIQKLKNELSARFHIT